jgi:hypothetical protein
VKFTIINQLKFSVGIAVAAHVIFETRLLDATLADVNSGIAARPEVLGVSIPIVPPSVRNTVPFQW